MLRLPLHTYFLGRLEPSLSPLASGLRITLFSCGVLPVMLTLSRACLAITYFLMLLQHPSGNTCILIGSPCNCSLPHAIGVAIQQCSHSHGQANPPSTAQAAIIIVVVFGLPSLFYSLRLPLNAPIHCHCWAVIIALFPLAASKRLVHCRCWAAIVALFPQAASKHPICHCHWAVILTLFTVV